MKTNLTARFSIDDHEKKGMRKYTSSDFRTDKRARIPNKKVGKKENKAI